MFGRNIALTLLVGLAAAYVAWQHMPAAWTSVQILGVCLAVVGFLLWTVARFQLGSSFTVSPQAKQLVTRGLYSRIRNPIYVFGSVFIAGYILLLGRPVWLLLFAGVIPLQIWRARKEAQVLEASFGDVYRQYRSRVWF
jgi:protein-S-isoprenylcysteine O-methyltransferase Ste14